MSPKRAARLRTKKYREAEGMFLAEGTPLLEETTVPPVQVFDQEAQIHRISALKSCGNPRWWISCAHASTRFRRNCATTFW